ncbi:MAG: DUF3488 and transglutaminase-like domain-containing protein [Pseudomonadota bacterium]
MPPVILTPVKAILSRDKVDTLLLLLACCLVLAPHAAHVAPWITVVSIIMLVWRGWITFRGNRMPPRWILAPIALLIVPGVYATHQTFFGRDAGVAMLVLLLTCKLLEMRARRDLFVVVCLCFFLMLTNLFYSQSFGTAVLMVAATVAILTTQLSYQYTGVVPSLKRRLKLANTIVALATPLMLVLFVLFPRIQGPLWGTPGEAPGGRSGMSDTMSPGTIAKLTMSEDIAFRANFIDPLPSRSALYWRGVVLGVYDGLTWRVQPAGSALQPDQQSITIVPKGPPVRYQVTMERSGQPWLYALEVPQQVPDVATYATSVTSDLQLRTNRPISQRIRYDVTSIVNFSLQPDQDQLSLQDWLDLPPGFNPETHAYAARLRRDSDNDATLLRTVLAQFRTQPFRYTLEPPLLGRHGVDDFLFRTRAGFCEHYAGAFVVLMRALDIPARVVTGYQGGQVNPVDRYFTVRQSDAHAWAEVWLRGQGWVRVDPTAAVAPERVERGSSAVARQQGFGGLMRLDMGKHSMLSSLNLRFEAMGNGWNQWVLNYTPERQRNLLQSFGLEKTDWPTLTIVMIVVGSLVMLIVAVPLLWQRTQIDPVQNLYAKLCRQMARRGLPRAPHEGPRAYLERLKADDSPLPVKKRVAVSSFMALYESARYGAESRSETVGNSTKKTAKNNPERARLIRQLTLLLTKST